MGQLPLRGLPFVHDMVDDSLNRGVQSPVWSATVRRRLQSARHRIREKAATQAIDSRPLNVQQLRRAFRLLPGKYATSERSKH